MAGYTHADAFNSGYLQVSSLHKIFYSQYGRQDGKTGKFLHLIPPSPYHMISKPSSPPTQHQPTNSHPHKVIFVHGGPGGGTTKKSTTFFDPDLYHVVLLDQRGAGKSEPPAEIRENTTQHLIADIEALRAHLYIDKWDVVFGGSWGSTLALAYAEAHPDVVGSLVLRGIFLGEAWEIDWTYGGGGAASMFPDYWADMVSLLPEKARDDPLKAYHEIFTGGDEEYKKKAAWNWARWEMRTCALRLDDDLLKNLEDEKWTLQFAGLEAHYFMNGCFLGDEKTLLREDNVARIKGIPSESFMSESWLSRISWARKANIGAVYIVQGRYDVVCPPKAAWALHTALPDSKLYFVDDAGHNQFVSL